MISITEMIRLIKRIDLRLVGQGYSLKDKMKILETFFVLAPLRKLGLTKKEILITLKNEEGIFICGDKSIHGASTLYEKELRKYFDLKEGVFIDVGANFGKYTIVLARQLGDKGEVVSIEPEERSVDLIKKNIVLNNLENVRVIGKACSSKDGKATLWLEDTKYSGGLHSLKKNKDHVRKKTIDIEKLDSIVARLNLDRVDLIKIDVEGLESEVLLGAKKTLKKYHPKIIFESGKDSISNVLGILGKFKYRVKKLDPNNFFAI